MTASTAATTEDRYALAKTALAQIPHPVVIIGSAAGAERSCATGTAMYVSLAPALIAVAEGPGTRTTRLIRASAELSVSLLRRSQQDIAVAAGRSPAGDDKFAALRIATVPAPAGFIAPGVAGSLAVLWCKVREEHVTGDHVLFIAEVMAHHAALRLNWVDVESAA